MKILIAYYSTTGNTEKVALRMKDVPKREGKPLAYIVICSSLILLLISFSPLAPFSPKKNNVVAFDAYHHKLESPFFSDDTLIHSTLRYLGSIGYTTLILNEPITADTLKSVSIFIIETPENDFTLEEIEYIINSKIQYIGPAGTHFGFDHHRCHLIKTKLNFPSVLKSFY